MSRRLTDLLDWDAGFRWRMLALSMIFSAGCGFAAQAAGCNRLTSLIIAGAAGISLGIRMAINYVRTSKGRRKKDAAISDPWQAISPLVKLSVFFFLLVAISPMIRSAVLNARLKTVLAATQSPFKAANADHILRVAAKSHVQLRSDLEVVARAEANRLNIPDVWSQYILSVNNKVRLRSPEATTPLSAVNRLDRMTMTNGIFEGEVVSYAGGPMNLKNVCFYNVRFDIQDSANGREFANAILSSPTNCISISLP